MPLVTGLLRRLVLGWGAQSEERRLAGVPTHYFRLEGAAGSDPQLPIVLIHGIADNALTWALMLPALRRIGPVYAIDLPGFGLSGYPAGRRYATIAEQAAVVRALIAEVIGRPALLVGNSMGGWVAARLALDTPDLARGIVLLDPGGAMLGGRSSWEPFVATVAVPDLRTVRRIYRQMFGLVPPPLYLGQHSFRQLFRRDAVAHFVEAADEDAFFRPEELQRMQVPTALVWGLADRFLPAGSLEFFRENLPGPEILLLRGCGHLPQRERPRRVARFIQSFVKDHVMTMVDAPMAHPPSS